MRLTIMKLKAKDEIILRLIEETEHALDFMDEDNMGAHGCDAKHCCQGRIDILKWVLSISSMDVIASGSFPDETCEFCMS
jgi:hypothetical protein